jgi:phage replication-related protein YjqB (UPF0714/DUF867 family)
MASRRAVLAGMAAAAVGGPVLGGLGAGRAYATSANDTYRTNTLMYAAFERTPEADGEGVDFMRRYKRHEWSDFSKAPVTHPQTTVLAIHGGGIEPGTSELCMAVAGYDPNPEPRDAAGQPLPFPQRMAADGPFYDFWMFEGIRPGGKNPDGTPKPSNKELHVTSIHCDDPIALALVGANQHCLSIHGCSWDDAYPAPLPQGKDKRGVVIGGLDENLRKALAKHIGAAGFQIFPGTQDVGGVAPENICNRTRNGAGAQLELTTELRESFFGDFEGAKDRGRTFNGDFRKFVNACRAAIAEFEYGFANPQVAGV